ncbi:MAG: T9SS type A sorting domain-containing protein, partial [Bacteroidetes bacterium]|nr:T9SS type A sorting domain-containing protein [Bacteroidota bacterium]
LALAVSPTDENLLFLGGINTWRSRDGGVSWDISNMWTAYTEYNVNNTVVVHADKHCLKFNNSTLYEGNDGGIYKSLDNGLSWTDLSDGIIISQLYRLGVSASSENEVITGLQDNGSKLFESDNWIDVLGGDGTECFIDYSNANIQYASYQEGVIFRTNVKWNNYSRVRIDTNIGDGTLEGSWVTPYIINPINPKSIYVGYESVWKSTDYGSTFTKYSTISTGQKFRSMAIAPSDTMVMYVADFSNIWKTKDDGAQWNVITGTLPVRSNSITYIAVHSNDPNTVWVTMGGYGNEHVFETIDGGDSWTDISGGLPNLPVFCIVQDKQIPLSDYLYAGTDIGVFVKEGKSDWKSYSSGLPNVMVTELEIYYNDADAESSRIYASTYGRGLWTSGLLEGPDLAIDATLHSIINPLQKSYCGETTITPSIVVKNSGNETITNLGISYIYDGSDPASFNWNGSLESGSFVTISLPEIDLSFGEHTFTATIDEINGGADDYNLNNMKSFNYSVIDEENISLPMAEGFNNSFIPGCWTSEIITDEGSVGTPSLLFIANGDDPLISPSEGSHMLKFNSKDCDNNDKIRLISPLFSSIEGDTLTISFVWSEDPGDLKRNDNISVQWSTDRISWTNLASYTRYNIDNPGWMPKSVSFPLQEEQKTSLYIGFLFKSSNGNNCYLDDLSIAISEPLISIGTIIGSPFYVSNTKEASIEIPYTANVQFNSNTFTAYLDSLGDYDDEIEIGFITSDGSGVILSAIPAKTPSSENYNVRIKSTDPIYVSSKSNSFEIIYDSIAPELIISSVVGSSTSVSPINVKFTFTEEIVGFELSDIDVDNGIASNLQKINAQEYEADITPYAGGLVLAELKEDVIQDLAGNLNESVVQWSTEYVSGVGINELSQLGISIYPNPSSGIFTINFSKNGTYAKIRVINLIGEVLSTVELDNRNTYKLDLSSLAKGVYILQIEVDQQIIDTQLIIQ